MSGELFKHMTGTDIVHIPYKGGAPAIADLIAATQLMFESTNSTAARALLAVRALAVTGERRASSLPEVPTLMEAGVPGYEVNAGGRYTHRRRAATGARQAERGGQPRDPAARNKRAPRAARQPRRRHRTFAALIRRDSAKWAEVVRRSGAKID